jgi:hypothetical protein
VTYDGVPFECNFQGEVRYTGCGDWAVHAIAEPINASDASAGTVLTSVSVRYLTDTAVTMLSVGSEDNYTLSTGSVPFVVYLNGLAVPSAGLTGQFLSVHISNRTVTIADVASNFVRLMVFDQLIAMATVPSAGCQNHTTGLPGNNNGDTADEFVAFNSSVTVPWNSTNETIYATVVVTHLVMTFADSLFPAQLFVPGNLSFVPKPLNTTALNATCPAACLGDASCCYDVAAGGAQMIVPYLEFKNIFNRANALVVNVTPVPSFTLAPADVGVTPEMLGAAYEFQYVAYDAHGMVSLTCDVCSAPSTLCTPSAAGPDQLSLLVQVLHLFIGTLSCNATNALGGSAIATTILYSLAALTPQPTPAPPVLPPPPPPANEIPRWTLAPPGSSSASAQGVAWAVVTAVSIFLAYAAM